jgi:hypothetical protein
MNSLKYKNALRNFSGHQGQRTIDAILAEIGPELVDTLTGAQLGKIMDAMQRARANAKAENCGFDLVDGSALWIPGVEKDGSDGKLVPTLALRAIKIETATTHRPAKNDPTKSFLDTTHRYTLDAYEFAIRAMSNGGA